MIVEARIHSGNCDATTQGIEQSYFSVLPYFDKAEIKDGLLVLGSSFSDSFSFKFAIC